jgi:hypothetical protein
MDHQRTVFLIGGGTGGDEEAVFTLHVDGAVCSLTCGYRDKVIKAEEEDFFEALFQIRQALEADDLVDIFDDGVDVIPVFVHMQQEFWEEWLASLPS